MIIYKYSVKYGLWDLELPEGSKVLSVQTQHGKAFMWVLQDVKKPMVVYNFQVVSTGDEFEVQGTYIGTFQLHGGDLIHHLFQLDN